MLRCPAGRPSSWLPLACTGPLTCRCLAPRPAEAEHGAKHHTDTAAFLQAATKDVYGTTKGGSLEDTVGRRAYFNERREGGAAFRKTG